MDGGECDGGWGELKLCFFFSTKHSNSKIKSLFSDIETVLGGKNLNCLNSIERNYAFSPISQFADNKKVVQPCVTKTARLEY